MGHPSWVGWDRATKTKTKARTKAKAKTKARTKAKATTRAKGKATTKAWGYPRPLVERSGSCWLVLRHRGVDLVGPGEDASGEVRDVGEAGLLEGEGGLLAAGSGAAVDDDLAVLLVGEFAYAALDLAHWNQGCAEVS